VTDLNVRTSRTFDRHQKHFNDLLLDGVVPIAVAGLRRVLDSQCGVIKKGGPKR
jgi:hypothetical protein